LGVPPAALEPPQAHIDQQVTVDISADVEELIEQSAVQDEGRKHELRTGLSISTRTLATLIGWEPRSKHPSIRLTSFNYKALQARVGFALRCARRTAFDYGETIEALIMRGFGCPPELVLS
jgi:hypothetical protein